MESIWVQRRTIVVYALSLLALVEIIDLTVLSVAIPTLMGALSANITEISLTMTSYIVAAAICIPLNGLVVDRLGMKRVASLSVLLFAISSVLCGLSNSLHEMIFFRILQGIGGAFLPSLAQSYVTKHFDATEQPKVMTVFTMGVVLGPIIGPIMGGYIVEYMSWRWIFYINLPLCILGYIMVAIFMEHTPGNKNTKIDYISFLFMTIGVGCLEYFLDEGNAHDWLNSIKMVIVLAIAIVFICFFIWRGLLGKSVVNFKIFKTINYDLACVTIFCFFAALIGGLSFFSTFLQQQYNYPVSMAGLLQSPRGVAAVIAAPIYLGLSKKFDVRILMACSMLLAGVATLMLSYFGLAANVHLIIILVLMQGFGMIGVFVLLMPLAFIGIDASLTDTAAGVFNFFRNLSMSVGTSIASTLLSNQNQVAWHDLVSHISLQNSSYRFIDNLHYTHGSGIYFSMLSVIKNASLLSYIDLFHASGVALIFLCWIPFLLKTNGRSTTAILH